MLRSTLLKKMNFAMTCLLATSQGCLWEDSMVITQGEEAPLMPTWVLLLVLVYF